MVVICSRCFRVLIEVIIAVLTIITQPNHFIFPIFIEGQLARNDSYVTLNDFLVLVALFGPFKPGPDGCLQKVNSAYSIDGNDIISCNNNDY